MHLIVSLRVSFPLPTGRTDGFCAGLQSKDRFVVGWRRLSTLVIGMVCAAISSSLGQEIATDWRTTSADASSGAETGFTFDRLATTGWSSAIHADALHTESLTFGMDALRQVNYLKITPRTNGNGEVIGLPVNFSVQWSAGAGWNDARSFSHVPRPADGSAFIVRLPLTVTANALRITAAVLGEDLAGNYALQVAEVSAGYDPAAGAVDQPLATVGASSVDGGGWEAANAIDGNLSTIWSSTTHSTSASSEWLQFGLNGGAHATVNYIKLRPRFSARALGFPIDFSVSYYDGTTWKTAVSHADFPNPTTDEWIILPLPAVDSYQFKITATRLGTVGANNSIGDFVFQLADVAVGYDIGLEQLSFLGNATYALSDGATNQVSTGASSSSAIAGTNWATANAIDGNLSTLWSSLTRTSASNTEWIRFGFSGGANATINYIRIRPRFNSPLGRALGFPVNFTISYNNGGIWTTAQTHSSFTTPTTADWVLLPLPTVGATQVQVTATTLGTDDVGNYVFQLAEIVAGYDVALENAYQLGKSVSGNRLEVRNVGSESFTNPSELGNWVYDTRNPLITPGAGNNIYAPSVVRNGTGWNIYYGGWDTTNTHDQILMTTSADDFMSFGGRSLQIASGTQNHVNNVCVVKTATDQWKMMFTSLPYGSPPRNKPMVATSTNGTTWTPSEGNTSALLTMSGYTDASNSAWTTADVNGGNHFLYENGTYHMWFDDFNNFKVHYATSTNFKDFTYQGVALNEVKVCNDAKAFSYGGLRQYLWAYHLNGGKVWYSTGTAVTTPSASKVLFSSNGAADAYIVAPCFVTDGTRLYGALYGAGAVSGLTKNRIFAKWLQKKVVFTTTSLATLGGTANQSYGPDRQQLAMDPAKTVVTGRFSIYDTDGVSLLYVSPQVTIRKGDVWNYTGQSTILESPPASVLHSSYSSWISKFAVNDMTHTGDPDGDSLNNLLEYVLDDDPGTSNQTKLPTFGISDAQYVFAYNRREGSGSDTSQSVQHSDDLVSWIDIPVAPGTQINFGTPLGGLEPVAVVIPPSSAGKRFARLKVTLR